jgi:hypothetical protein
MASWCGSTTNDPSPDQTATGTPRSCANQRPEGDAGDALPPSAVAVLTVATATETTGEAFASSRSRPDNAYLGDGIGLLQGKSGARFGVVDRALLLSGQQVATGFRIPSVEVASKVRSDRILSGGHPRDTPHLLTTLPSWHR